jgi:hypothetical protein
MSPSYGFVDLSRSRPAPTLAVVVVRQTGSDPFWRMVAYRWKFAPIGFAEQALFTHGTPSIRSHTRSAL